MLGRRKLGPDVRGCAPEKRTKDDGFALLVGLRAHAHKLLDEIVGQVVAAVDEQTDGRVERETDQLVDLKGGPPPRAVAGQRLSSARHAGHRTETTGGPTSSVMLAEKSMV